MSKKITKNTLLKQGENTYQPVEGDGVIYWINEYEVAKTGELYLTSIKRRIIPKSEGVIQAGDKIIAQSEPKIDGVPVVSMGRYVERLAMNYISKKGVSKGLEQRMLDAYIKCYTLNSNQYTLADIEKAYDLGKASIIYDKIHGFNSKELDYDQINSINLITVDEQFNILSYE